MKVLASDFDGTLYVKDKKVVLRNIEAIKDFVKQGNLFGIVTGRNYSNLKKLLNEYQEFPTVWRFIYSKKILIEKDILFNENVQTGEDILFNFEYLIYAKKLIVCDENFYCYVWRNGSLTQNTKDHFYNSKKLLIQERDKLIEKIKINTGLDYSNEYVATLILSKIQMGVVLSKCKFKELFNEFVKFKDYSNFLSIKEAYKLLDIKKIQIKYKLAFIFAKYNLNFLLFFILFLMNKLNLHVYPDE